MAIEFVKISPHKSFEKEMTVMGMEKIALLRAEARRKAHMFRDQVKNYIMNQEGGKLSWIPLTSKWLAEKKKQGWSLDFLIASKSYLNSIIVKEGTDEFIITVEDIDHVVKTASGRTKSIPMKSLAFYLENGTGRMWGRPHWSPSWARFVNRYARIIKL